MFLKKNRFTKNGNLYEYYKIVETYKDESGRSKHRVVKHLGRLTDEEAAEVRQGLKEQGKRAIGMRAGTSRSMKYEAAKKPVIPPPQQIPVLLDSQSIAYKPYDQKEWNVTEADMLLLVREGTGELFMNGRKIELVYGLVVYAPAGSGMFVVNTGSGMLHLGRLTVEAIRKSARSAGKDAYIEERFAAGFHDPIRLKSPHPIMQLFKELHSLNGNGQPYDVFRRQLLFYRILDMLSANMPETGERETAANMEQTMDFIHEHFHDALTRDQLAGQLGVSPAHFSRLFRKEAGMSFSDYLMQLRIEKAKELLLLSSSGVAEIARQVGFENAHYFSRKFKQMAGISPSAYIHQPKTYISLDAGMTACLLTIGIVPRACVLPAWMREHFGHLLDEAECITIDGLEEQNIRLLRELKPDLIFCNVHKMDMEPVAQLGPVAAIDLEAMDWRELIRYIADVVGRQQEAETWLISFEKRLELAKQQLSRVLHEQETFAILHLVSGKMHIYGDLRSMGGPMIYRCLQLPPPAAVKEHIIDQDRLNIGISAAELPEYSADHLIIVNYASNWVDHDKTLASQPQWKKFAAVRKKQVYEVNRELFYGFDPLSLELQMEEIVKVVTSRHPSHL